MRKCRSVSEVDYKNFYRWLRITGGSVQPENYPFGLNECQDLAILSFDYHDSEFSGWINRQRQERFEQCLDMLRPERHWPF